jgi:hypothetical protein
MGWQQAMSLIGGQDLSDVFTNFRRKLDDRFHFVTVI